MSRDRWHPIISLCKDWIHCQDEHQLRDLIFQIVHQSTGGPVLQHIICCDHQFSSSCCKRQRSVPFSEQDNQGAHHSNHLFLPVASAVPTQHVWKMMMVSLSKHTLSHKTKNSGATAASLSQPHPKIQTLSLVSSSSRILWDDQGHVHAVHD